MHDSRKLGLKERHIGLISFYMLRVLSSDAILSTDEESSSEEASDLDELGKDLESMLSNKKGRHEVFNYCTVCSLGY